MWNKRKKREGQMLHLENSTLHVISNASQKIKADITT